MFKCWGSVRQDGAQRLFYDLILVGHVALQWLVGVVSWRGGGGGGAARWCCCSSNAWSGHMKHQGSHHPV